MRRQAYLLTLALMLLPPSLRAEQTQQSQEKVFHVGVIIALTGDAAAVGQAFRNGLELGMEKLPAEAQRRIELFYEDDAMHPKNTLSAYRRLQGTKPIDLVLSISTPTSFALLPTTEREKVPLFSIGSNTEMVATARYAMNFWVGLDTLADLAVEEALRRGYKRIVRMTAAQEGRVNVSRAFDRSNQGRIEIVLDEEVMPTERDFRPYITKIQQLEDVDAIYVNLIFGQVGLFVKQAKEMGIKLPFFNSELFGDKKEIELAHGALCGEWYVNGKLPTEEFQREYAQRFPDASTFSAANAYDIMGILGQAVVKSSNREELLQNIRAVKDYTGVMGTYSALPTNRFSIPGEVITVTEGCKPLGRAAAPPSEE